MNFGLDERASPVAFLLTIRDLSSNFQKGLNLRCEKRDRESNVPSKKRLWRVTGNGNGLGLSSGLSQILCVQLMLTQQGCEVRGDPLPVTRYLTGEIPFTPCGWVLATTICNLSGQLSLPSTIRKTVTSCATSHGHAYPSLITPQTRGAHAILTHVARHTITQNKSPAYFTSFVDGIETDATPGRDCRRLLGL
eukprot:4392736-Prymnesium_polylepis.2